MDSGRPPTPSTTTLQIAKFCARCCAYSGVPGFYVPVVQEMLRIFGRAGIRGAVRAEDRRHVRFAIFAGKRAPGPDQALRFHRQLLGRAEHAAEPRAVVGGVAPAEHETGRAGSHEAAPT